MTVGTAVAAYRVSCQLETLWDFDYEPSHREVELLYHAAKKGQWDASAIDWSRRVGDEGRVIDLDAAYRGATFLQTLTPDERREAEVRVAAWRLSQFLHGEQGGLVITGQLVSSLGGRDAKLYAATQVADEARHVEVFSRYIKRLHRIYPVDPLLRTLFDDILGAPYYEAKLIGNQLVVEGLAIAAFTVLRRDTGDPTLAQVLDYVVRDEGRHVSFGYLALKRALAEADLPRREYLEDFALAACQRVLGTVFPSLAAVWTELGWDADAISRDIGRNASAAKAFDRRLFTGVLLPRLQGLGLLSPRVEPRYRALGLVE